MACLICKSITDGDRHPDICAACHKVIESGDWVEKRHGRNVVISAASTGVELARYSLLSESEVELAIDWGRRIQESGDRLVENIPLLTPEELKHLWAATQELDRTTIKIRCAITAHLYEQLEGNWREKIRYIREVLDVSESTVANSLRIARAFGAKLEALDAYPEHTLHWGHINAAARAGGKAALKVYDKMSEHGNRQVPVGDFKAALGLTQAPAKCPHLKYFCTKSGTVLQSEQECSLCEEDES